MDECAREVKAILVEDDRIGAVHKARRDGISGDEWHVSEAFHQVPVPDVVGSLRRELEVANSPKPYSCGHDGTDSCSRPDESGWSLRGGPLNFNSLLPSSSPRGDQRGRPERSESVHEEAGT